MEIQLTPSQMINPILDLQTNTVFDLDPSRVTYQDAISDFGLTLKAYYLLTKPGEVHTYRFVKLTPARLSAIASNNLI